VLARTYPASLLRGAPAQFDNNHAAGITSDCLRLDNCIRCKVHDNLLFSYNGTHNNGAYENGENGLQIGDSGVSHGYDARDKPTSTSDIEVYNNVFADNGLQAILLDSMALAASANVFIHDNSFIGKDQLETMGIPVDIGTGTMPTVEQSERVFSSIFDILNMNFTDSGRTTQTADDIPISVQDTTQGKIAGGIKIVGFKDEVVIDNKTYIPDENATLVKYKAFKAPTFNIFGAAVDTVTPKVNVKIENGTAKATLNVIMKWYSVSTNSITKKTVKSYHTEIATFNDFCTAPEILDRLIKSDGYVNVFNENKNQVSRIRVSHTNTTQMIEYTYKGNTSIHKFMIGERVTDDAEVQYTAYSRCDIWEGTIPHMGDELVITGNFDKSQLHIKYYTPYYSSDVEDIEIIYHKNEGESQLMVTFKFIVSLLLGMLAGYKIMKIIIN
jgi:hypothetical protein